MHMYFPGMASRPEIAGMIPFPALNTALGRINFGGRLRKADVPAFTGFRRLGMYAVVVLLKGGGRYRDERGADFRLAAGDLIVVFPELGHHYGPEPGDEWEEIFLCFEGAAFDAWRADGLDPAHPVWPVLTPGRWEKQLEALLRHPPATRGEACTALGALHRLIAEWLALRPWTDVPRWLDASRHALAASADGPAIAEVARAAGLGLDGFRRAFRQATGETPAGFRRRQRLAQAAQLLRRPELTLQQIAELLGFCDAFHLSKAFKQHHGKSPQAYRATPVRKR